ncbi:Asparagine synthetase 1 [Pirellula sp. SH-Sr6A]|uniref:asparagine synthase (glutamine-hydrolyzing) n=1 Tax=Pirellula sp. SH-Sr6A TaxID=1632865 RepID=UPI00078E5DE9|nr:asparagine synthase (glutamine-hydrolyzing) [Pirellula sp. SH-Sr6A]AMV33560.1 Asparagine synthetase 1 [Pirellula sp. SH-Sr6A]
MCGIAGGVWPFGSVGIEPDILQRMTQALVHRGPDDEGAWISPAESVRLHADSRDRCGVALGFRRLSIIDLSTGHQPLGNEDGSVQIVFNGEIYNYRELRHRLEGSGHRFETHSDTETIVHLYEDLGLECFHHLNGMFALAIWDARENRLVLARDRMGKKPLYYTLQDGTLYFASELKSLLQVPAIRPEIDPGSIDLYLTYQYIPHPHTIYKGIRKLEPGHCAVFQSGELTVQKYWSVDWSFERPLPLKEAKEQLRELLTDAIRLRLRSDVPLGAFLSGGIDSSLVVALAQRELQQPIQTFSIGFSEADFDETGFAQQVADHVGTQHQRFEVTPDALDIIDKLSYQYDEPFSDSSAVPTWYLSELTRRHVTVALSGDGGDELFGGYERYRALVLSHRLQHWFPVQWLQKTGILQRLPDSSARRSLLRRVRRFCEALGQGPVERYMNWIQIFGEAQRLDLFRDDFVTELPDRDPVDFLRRAWEASGKRDLVSCATAADLQTYMPCDLMTKVDIASMAHSLEARQPLLDYRLVEWAASLPSSLKLRGSVGKYLLRETFADLLPAAIWNRPKMGFGVPIARWFRTSLRDRTYDALLSSETKCHRYFRKEAIQSLVDAHMSGRENQAYRLWNLLMFELWLRRWNP